MRIFFDDKALLLEFSEQEKDKLKAMAQVDGVSVACCAKRIITQRIQERDSIINNFQNTLRAYRQLVGPKSFTQKIFVREATGIFVVTTHIDICKQHDVSFANDFSVCEVEMMDELDHSLNIHCVFDKKFNNSGYHEVYPNQSSVFDVHVKDGGIVRVIPANSV